MSHAPAPRLGFLGPFLALLFSVSVQARDEPRPWHFQGGDRVVLVGDTFIERDQRYGYLETGLTVANPGLNLTFRNLGWSGDTVAGLSRAGFDPPEAGWLRLKEQILAAKPTVVIIGYGMADSFEGRVGINRFIERYDALLDAISPTRARLILLSPIAHEDHGRPLPDPAAHNRDLEDYTEAIRKIAGKHDARFIDLYQWFTGLYEKNRQGSSEKRTRYLTDDGIHLTEEGYQRASIGVISSLSQQTGPGSGWLTIRRSKETLEFEASEVVVTRLKSSPGQIEIEVLGRTIGPVCITLQDPVPGPYRIVDGEKTVVRTDAAKLASGLRLEEHSGSARVESLRRTINEKNSLFFHRWRPQNITYLFGFRKHEQGNNSIEVPQFDPLIEEKEREIRHLAMPSAHRYKVIRESEVGK